MVYLRGHRHDYNEWPSDENERWTFDEILRFFKRSERQQGRYRSNGN